MTQSRLVLLDANIVIELFRLGIWNQITERCDIVLAETVVEESAFYDTPDGREYIDWDAVRNAGTVRIESLPVTDIKKYCDKFGQGYFEKLDPGEAEALALLARETGSMICSADKIVWRVLGNTNATERGISLEEILQSSGLTKQLQRRFTKAFRQEWNKKGGIDRFMGTGDNSDFF
jgi:hypothetical protein